jgi:hypothetical protein
MVTQSWAFPGDLVVDPPVSVIGLWRSSLLQWSLAGLLQVVELCCGMIHWCNGHPFTGTGFFGVLVVDLPIFFGWCVRGSCFALMPFPFGESLQMVARCCAPPKNGVKVTQCSPI